jgi:thiol peroxidase
MATTKLKGNPVALAGSMPAVGDAAPDFKLVKSDLSAITHKDIAGKTTILLTVPSLDTPVCQIETRKFNEKAATLPNVTVLVASPDLTFAIKRFCAAEGIDKVHGVSDIRDRTFGKRWGVEITEGPFEGIMARAAFVIDPNNRIKYVELVPEIAEEPNYDAILAAAAG